MKYNSIFSKVPVKVPNRAGHNMSHENLFTAKCGTLTPFFVEPVYPNEKHTVSVSTHIQLPPFVTDVYGRVDAVFELFFVPNRLLYGGWQEFITYQTQNSNYPSGTINQEKPKVLPCLSFGTVTGEQLERYAGAGSLADYLGYKRMNSGSDNQSLYFANILPFVAYHKIWTDWYRDSRIQKDCFFRPTSTTIGTVAGTLPYVSFGGDSAQPVNSVLGDSKDLLSLRQRLWAKDYFTNSTPLPQNGEPFKLSMTPDASGKVSFSMNQLYSLNSLQQFSIRHNIAGNRYSDNIFAQFGCYPSDAIVDRSLYLGRKIVPIYTKSVYQTSEDNNTTQNPFNSVGVKFGSPQGVGSGNLVSNFKTTEHGFLFGLFSLVPRPYYSSGVRRYLMNSRQSDFPFPILHGIGDQPIFVSELMDSFDGDIYSGDTFGYTQYASEVKFHPDEVHGLLRDGQSLDSFAIQRSFSSVPSLGTEFLEIPTNFLDQVTAVNGQISQYGCWVNAHINYKKASPFQPYTIPTLGDIENSHTIMVDKGGKRL